jgi:hypothetical protein
MIRIAFGVLAAIVVVAARMLAPRTSFVRPPGVYDSQ